VGEDQAGERGTMTGKMCKGLAERETRETRVAEQSDWQMEYLT